MPPITFNAFCVGDGVAVRFLPLVVVAAMLIAVVFAVLTAATFVATVFRAAVFCFLVVLIVLVFHTFFSFPRKPLLSGVVYPFAFDY